MYTAQRATSGGLAEKPSDAKKAEARDLAKGGRPSLHPQEAATRPLPEGKLGQSKHKEGATVPAKGTEEWQLARRYGLLKC